jgi:ribosome recycling factor
MSENLVQETKEHMEKTIQVLHKDLSRVRTGRASLSLLDGIKVDYYGTLTPINQVATLSIPESRLISIQPWDTTVIPEIEKAILKSELGLNPMNDGKIIRITIPNLSEERRKELVKVVKKIVEDAKVTLRNHRRSSNEGLKELKKEKGLSEDDYFKRHDEIQKITDGYIALCDKISGEKEKEILEF